VSEAPPTPTQPYPFPALLASRATRRGRVTAFDVHVGLGEILADDGTELPFHCTAITDGSRTIPVGVEVVFLVVPGPVGRLEATSVTALATQALSGDPGALG